MAQARIEQVAPKTRGRGGFFSNGRIPALACSRPFNGVRDSNVEGFDPSCRGGGEVRSDDVADVRQGKGPFRVCPVWPP